MEEDIIQTLLAITPVLEQLAIPYLVGGSLASSVYGDARSTRDVDILAQIAPKKVGSLFTALTPHFFVQRNDIAEAVAAAPGLREDRLHRSTFSAVHQRTHYQVDMFVSSGRPFEVEQLQRRQHLVVGSAGEQAYLASTEDMILVKLEWYDMNNRTLDSQWKDVRGMVLAQQQLDLRYMRTWAARLGVGALLERAIAGESPYDEPEGPRQGRLW